MSRTTLLAIVALVVAIGLPVAIVALDGGDDDPSPGTAAGRTFPEGIDVDNAPAEQLEPEREAGGRERRKEDRRGGGPPQHATDFDESMSGVSYPNAITQTGAPAVQAVERAVGPEVEQGQQTVIAADCRKGVCSVRYRAQGRGTGQIVADQQRILRSLFAREQVRRVVLYVHHKTVGRKKEERPAFIVVTCTRRPGFDWSRIRARQIPRRCEVVDEAGGRLRSEVRRGRVSVGEASRGEGATSGGQSGASGEQPAGLDPAGTPAPENVNPKPAKGGDGKGDSASRKDEQEDGGRSGG